MVNRLTRFFILMTLFGLQGCTVFQPIRQITRDSWRVMKPDPTDYRDPTQEFNDQWSGVGKEGRGDQQIEKDADPLKKIMMSEKARSIDRNLGYGD